MRSGGLEMASVDSSYGLYHNTGYTQNGLGGNLRGGPTNPLQGIGVRTGVSMGYVKTPEGFRPPHNHPSPEPDMHISSRMTSLPSSRQELLYSRMSDMSSCSERFQMQLHHHTNLFGGFDENFLSRAEAIAAANDLPKGSPPSPILLKHDLIYGGGGGVNHGIHDTMGVHPSQHIPRSLPTPSQHHHGFNPGMTESMLDQLSAAAMAAGCNNGDVDHTGLISPNGLHPSQMYPSVYSNINCNGSGGGGAMLGHSQHYHISGSGSAIQGMGQIPTPLSCGSGMITQSGNCSSVDLECDPRELEAFAEHFKQRRIKLGATQADVGSALGKLKLPGVGSLSQSTICRFESLTLSHNNMLALKPVLSAWLGEAERAARESRMRDEMMNGLADKKRKRTSIAAPEKRSLEAYFSIQPRPSGEKIAQIADKLDLKKNVVRVWFCNQRQKQKRMKFSATALQGPH